MADPVALVALALDAALGWPRALYASIGHPVGLFARVIDHCERRWNDARHGDARRRLMGVVTVLVLIALPVSVALLAQWLLATLPGPLPWLCTAVLAWPALAQRSLYDHVRPVAQALARDDVDAARHAVSMIVGRDTTSLDRAGIARAAIESLAESFCDGVAAPLFWLLVGGLPGIWAYKAVNTADSLIGHREERWRAFGWAAARSDDVLNLIPARIGGAVLCLAGGGGWRVMWRDHARHASPNAGWTEAAMAGALDLRLAGPVWYDGIAHDKDWIGDGRSNATAADIARALALYIRACLLLAGATALISWGI